MVTRETSMGGCKLVFVGKPRPRAEIAADDTVAQHQIDLARLGLAETVGHAITLNAAFEATWPRSFR